MRSKNELLVGVSILVAALILFLGVRFLSGVPLFGGTYPLVAIFDDAQGMTAGSPVLVNGVRVGRVEAVRLARGAQRVEVFMEIRGDVEIPRGATVGTGGFVALGDVSVSIAPGPITNPPLARGDTLYASGGGDLLTLLQDNADRLFGEADTLLTSASGTFRTVDGLLADSEGDLRASITALRRTTTGVDELLRSEQARLRATLANLEAASAGAASLTDDLGRFTEANAEEIAATIAQLNQTLAQVDASLIGFEATSTQLDEVLIKLNTDEGTLGLMLNDPELYYNLNSTLGQLNRLLVDFQDDPGRFLRELRLLRIF